MDAIYMNSKNSTTSDPYRLLINLWDKINLNRVDEYFALSNLSICYPGKNIKNSCKSNKLKYQPQHRIKNLIFLIDQIMYHTFNFILNIYQKNMEKRLMII